MKYSFILGKMSLYSVRLMCRVLDVSPAGFYAWRKRQPSVTRQNRDRLAAEIETIHNTVKHRYGSPRIHAELKARGHHCSVNTVARIMKELGIQAISHRRFRVQTTDSNHRFPVADNHLDQNFTVPEPNRVWLTDITYIPTREGWLYLAGVMDLHSRRIVGWSMDTTMTSRLVVDAMAMAVVRRCPGENLISHSDRGSQYASEHYQRVLETHGIRCSMSRRGNCYDNAPMESFFASLKKELVRQQDYPTIAAARSSVFKYIERFYNRLRDTPRGGTLPLRSSRLKFLNYLSTRRGEVHLGFPQRTSKALESRRQAVSTF
jgi:putative transposase